MPKILEQYSVSYDHHSEALRGQQQRSQKSELMGLAYKQLVPSGDCIPSSPMAVCNNDRSGINVSRTDYNNIHYYRRATCIQRVIFFGLLSGMGMRRESSRPRRDRDRDETIVALET